LQLNDIVLHSTPLNHGLLILSHQNVRDWGLGGKQTP